MPRKKFSTLLVLGLLLLTTVAVAAREWVENGALIIYPDATNPMTQFDEVTVEYEYRFVEEPGVTSARLIGYTNNNCGGGTDRWGGTPIAAFVTEQTTTLEGFTKLVMTPDAALLTPAIQSVTVEIRIEETNHQMTNRVDFYCRVVDHSATEAAAEAPADQPPLGEILGSAPIELHTIDPGAVLFENDNEPARFGTLTEGDQVTADLSYQFKAVPGRFEFALTSSTATCHASVFQNAGFDIDNWVDVSAETVREPDQMTSRESLVFTVTALPDNARSIWLRFERSENGERTGYGAAYSCFNVEDHTIDLLNISPGAVLEEEGGDGLRLGAIPRDATVTADMSFVFDEVPGTTEVRLMGLDTPCHRWLFNPSADPIPTNSYPVSSTDTQSFNTLENTATITLNADQMRPTTKGVYLEAHTFENGVETEHNVYLSCSDVTP